MEPPHGVTPALPSPPSVPPALAPGAAIGLVGTGALGAALAGLLVRGGFRVVAFDPAPAALANAVAQGATGAADACRLMQAVDAAIVCVSTVAALRATADAAVDAGNPPGLVIEMSTLPAAAKLDARERLAGRAVVLDCPVSGTSAQAAAGDLVVFASGEREAVESCRAVFAAVARRTIHAGPFGAGMQLKLLANHLVGLHSLVAAEVLMLAEAAGLDTALALEALNESAGGSKMLKLRGELMLRRTYYPPTASIDIIVKDGALIMDMARAAECRLPLFDRAYELFGEAQREGLGKDDIAAMLEHLTKYFGRNTNRPG